MPKVSSVAANSDLGRRFATAGSAADRAIGSTQGAYFCDDQCPTPAGRNYATAIPYATDSKRASDNARQAAAPHELAAVGHAAGRSGSAIDALAGRWYQWVEYALAAADHRFAGEKL